MCGLDTLLAVALLATPGGDVPGNGLASWSPALRPALARVAVQAELLDPRELRYLLVRPEDFLADLNLLRRRARNLANAPPVDDCLRFPSREVIHELLSANRAYRQHIEARQPIELSHTWSLRTVLQETDQLYLIWATLGEAASDFYQLPARRQALKKLRDLLGEEAYYRGTLPPSVPLWRFRWID